MDNKSLIPHLKELNLSDNEISIYLTLLSQGPSIAAKVAQRTHIHRRNIYDALERLSQKGLISYIKENKSKVYSITNPEHILNKLNQKTKDFQAILPELLGQYNSSNERRETLFFQGKEGIREIFTDQIEQGEEICMYATSNDVTRILEYYFPQFDRIRKEKNIHIRIICDETLKMNKAIVEYFNKIPLSKIKFVKEINTTPLAQYIYGNHLSLVLWSENPFGILIKQKEIAEAFKQNFEFIWNK